MKSTSTIAFVLFGLISFGQDFQFALLKYNGGGDWYANLETSLPNLAKFCNQELKTNINTEQAIVEASSTDIFYYPFIHVTGHGNIVFSDDEVANLRKYLMSGGFIHIDDNYGMDEFVRIEMLKVFPELEWVQLGRDHQLFDLTFKFPYGLPKVHDHDGASPEALALFYNGEMVCLYTYESDLGDGWEDANVHNDSEETRLEALQMGANIIEYVLMAKD